MFPNVRLMIAAMLASVVLLICGFGVFAAFRVSHEPIAHLPAAALPLQLIAESNAVPSTVLAARETVDLHSQSDVPAEESEGEAKTPTGSAEQSDQAELVARSEPTAAPQSVAARDADPGSAPEPEKEAATMPRPEQLRMPPAPASDLPVPGGNRTTDTAAEATSAPTPLQPAEPATAPQTGTSEAAADTSGEVAPNAQTAIAEAPPKKPIVVPGPETEPTAVASLAVEAMPDDAADRSEGGILSEPPLPRARPAVSGVKHVWHAQAARAADERPRNIAASRPRRARVVVVRSVRAVRFTEPYYAQTQYAQNIDQSYGYGESSFQGAQQQVVIRRVVRFHPARLAARKVNAAIGGPFVSVRSP